MTVRELREKYIQFFLSKGHQLHPSGSLIPYDVTGRLDESLLFNGAGMVQFKPYFRGVAEPPHPRLTNAQKCLRTGDIEEVGDASHLTFFEMLGNFSFGDYFKQEAIALSWEFMTSPEWLGLDPKRLSFTVFEDDDEAWECWAGHLRGIGIDPEHRVFRLGEETNFWPAGARTYGPPGPCGPNSEMFYWVEGMPPEGPYTVADYLRDEAEGRWLEIWNDVFIQYEWQGEESPRGWKKTGMPELPFRSVDTGMGLERTATVLGGYRSLYDTDAFTKIFAAIDGLNPRQSDETTAARRIIADHLRAATFCIADGIFPSNTGRGYVLRRLIRRAVLKGQRTLGFEAIFLPTIAEAVIDTVGDHYTELADRRDVIRETLRGEEEQFRRTLERGSKVLQDQIEKMAQRLAAVYDEIPGESTFERMMEEGLREMSSRGEIIAEQFRAMRVDGYMEAGLNKSWETLDYLVRHPEMQKDKIAQVLNTLCGQMENSDDPDVRAEAQKLRRWVESDGVDEALIQKLDDARPVLDGKTAFELYDTYGFPLEVTKEICAEYDVVVHVGEFNEAMAAAQERSRGASGMETVYGGVDGGGLFGGKKIAPTEFIGNDTTEGAGMVLAAAPQLDAKGNPTGRMVLALDRTPFYAESGGQEADTGLIQNGHALRVLDVQKQDGIFLHIVEGPGVDPASLEGQAVSARVDAGRRGDITRNHTATHLLHAALRQVLGNHASQAGSLVAPDHLRFDFTHGQAMTPQELSEVERIVNEHIWAADPVKIYQSVPIDEARAMGAMALFGEKYGDAVRVVQIGDMEPSETCWSRELCGGVHVRNTGQIGLFKITSESSAASGIRRIVAVTGSGAYRWVQDQQRTLEEAAARLKANPRELVGAIDKTLEALKEEKKKREKLAQQGAGGSASSEEIGAVTLFLQEMKDAEAKDAQLVSDRLVDNKPNGVALVVNRAEGKVVFVCKVGDGAVKAGAHAGNIVKAAAQAVGGGGGGRPNFATAGGKDSGDVAPAIEAAKEALRSQVG